MNQTLRFTFVIFSLFFTISLQAQALQEVFQYNSPFGQQGDFFGGAVSISGRTVLVTAILDDLDANNENPVQDAGSVYIFEKNDADEWGLVQKITSEDREPEARFGTQVIVQGNKAIVSAFLADTDANNENPVVNAGAVYYYEKQASGEWVQQQKLVAADRSQNDNFGVSVAMDGATLAVGAYRASTNANGDNFLTEAGAVYLFEQNEDGIWAQTQKVTASDREANAWFGFRIALEGNTLLAGAPREDKDEVGLNGLSNAGAVYEFLKNDDGIWEEGQKITLPSRSFSDEFGSFVELQNNSAIISDLNLNRVFHVRRINANWEFQETFYTNNSGNTANIKNTAIAGNFVIVGDDLSDGAGTELEDAGAAYLYNRTIDGQYILNQKLEADDQDLFFGFGSDVDMNDEAVVVTAQGNNALYIFENLPTNVEASTFDHTVRIFPNPTNGPLQVDFGQAYSGTLQIFSVDGKQVYQLPFRQQAKLSLNLDLPKGAYSLYIQTKDGQSGHTKLVIR
ncbi:MAG: T9SS type A sorting domain-containing protein [Saprospiraceae bacterium]|nr:T9SS type A sorting domain-containing protein [Saprospiraceae bacterium]